MNINLLAFHFQRLRTTFQFHGTPILQYLPFSLNLIKGTTKCVIRQTNRTTQIRHQRTFTQTTRPKTVRWCLLHIALFFQLVCNMLHHRDADEDSKCQNTSLFCQTGLVDIKCLFSHREDTASVY